MFLKKPKICLNMVNDTLIIEVINSYGRYIYRIDVDSMDIEDKHNAIRHELAKNGWILDKKMERAIGKGLYSMVIEEYK